MKSKPINVSITLDGESIKNEAGILNSGTLIDELASGKYHLVLNLDKYSGWQKNVDVEYGVVSVFDSIILVPNDRVRIGNQVDDFVFTNDLFVTKSESNIYFDGEIIPGDEIVRFTEDGSVLTKESEGDYYLSNVLNIGSSTNITALFNDLKESQLGFPGAVDIKKIESYPFDDNRFIVMTNRAIYALDTDDEEVEQIDRSATDFVISGNEVFWTNASGTLSYNLLTGDKALVDEALKNDSLIFDVTSSGNKIITLGENGRLLYTDKKLSTSTIISDNADYFSISPNGRFLMFVDNVSLAHVYDFEWESGDRGKELVRLVEVNVPVEKVLWYGNNAYLFVKGADDRLRFIEISDSYPINEALISEKVNSFVYDAKSETLYYSNDSGLWQLEI